LRTGGRLYPKVRQMAGVNILIVEHDPLVRRGLVDIVQSGFPEDRVVEAGDWSEAFMLCGEVRPALVIMNDHLPDADGVEMAAAIKTLLPRSKVVIVSNDRRMFRQEAARRMGASGYVFLEEASEKLLVAITVALGSD
jgi:two-component system, NarL family, nitrate/nitrite response regulator NarL